MAIRTISNAGGNWNNVATWVEGIVPTAADDVVATATSGNLTVNTGSACLSLNFTNYVGTFTINQNLAVGGNVTFVPGMTLAGISGFGMSIIANATITSAGLTLPVGLFFSATTAQTITLADNWTVVGTLSFNAGSTLTINNNQITALAQVNVSAASGITGTFTLVLGGVSTLQGNGVIRCNVNINSPGNTVTLTLSGTPTLSFNGATFTYTTAGSVVFGATNATLLCGTNATTLNTNGIVWPNITFQNVTVTLTSNLTTSGNFTVAGSVVNGASQIFYVGGNLSLTGVINLTGTLSEIVLNGTGNLNALSANIQINLTVNTTGAITFSNLVRYGVGTFKHIAGNVFANNNFETRAACTLDLSGIWLSGVVAYASFTLLSDLNVGNYTTQSNVVATGFSVRITGNIAFGGGLVQSGTSDFVICGSGRQFWYTGSGSLRNNLIINCTGVFIITRFLSTGFLSTNPAFGNIYSTGTITYVRGRVDASDCSLRLSTCTLKGLNKATTFREVIITPTSVITTDEFFSGSAKVPATISSSTPATNYIINFTDGFEKLARYVSIYSMTLTNTETNPGSLLVITPGAKKFLNRVIGNVRSINQLPNGFPKDGGQYIDPMTYPAAGLTSDPNFVLLR